LSTSRDSLVASATTASLISRRSASSSPVSFMASPEAMIAARGDRRSCDTDRIRAVFMTSERRSAPASIACSWSRSRVTATLTTAPIEGASLSRVQSTVCFLAARGISMT